MTTKRTIIWSEQSTHCRHAAYNFPKIKKCSKGHAIVGENIMISVRGFDTRPGRAEREKIRFIGCRTCSIKSNVRNFVGIRVVADGDRIIPWSERTWHSPNAGHNFPRIKKCSKGHEIVGVNILVVPETASYRGKVQCKNCNYARRNARSLSQPKATLVFEALREGLTINRIAGRIGPRYAGGAIASTTEITNFCRQNPKAGKLLLGLAEKNRIAQAIQRSVVRAPVHRNAHEAMALIARSVPYQNPNRDEIISLMAFDFAEGRLAFNDIPAAADKYRRKADRELEDKLARGRWGNNSIDAPLTFDSTTTIAETISVGFWT